MGKKHKDWSAEELKKVLFADESQFLAQGQHSRLFRRNKGEKIRSCHINEGVSILKSKCFGVPLAFKVLVFFFQSQG